MELGKGFIPGILAGKTAFVAGGSSGINLGIAQGLAEAGAKVGLISRSGDKVAAAVQSIIDQGGQAWGIAADVRDYDAVNGALRQARDTLGEIDIVISGAAGNFLSPALGLSANAFKTVVDIDLLGTFNVLRASFEYLRRPGASLISITAAQAERPTMFQIHACAAKAGVNMVTKCLAMEWGPAGVRVNAIAPGPISDTEGMARLAPSDEVTMTYKARIPMRDYGTKQHIADMAVFLASDLSANVTGAIFDCDGGAILGDASADALTVPQRSAMAADGKDHVGCRVSFHVK